MPRIGRIPVVILSLALLLPYSTAPAQDAGQAKREALADQIVNVPGNSAEAAAMTAMLTEISARGLFKQLRTDAAWNADHPRWKEFYPGFRTAFEAIGRRVLVAGMEQRLKTALATAMTESELEQVVAAVSGPEAAELRALMKSFGLDFASAIRIGSIAAQPALYSFGEKEDLKRQLGGLKEREAELITAQQRLEATIAAFKSPAFQKYQQVAQSALRQAVASVRTDPALRADLMELVTGFRARVSQP